MESNVISIKKLKSIADSKKLRYKDIGYSKVKNKKYYVINENNKRVNFGDKRYEDYLIHSDEKRRKQYRNRHKNDKIRNPDYAGY